MSERDIKRLFNKLSVLNINVIFKELNLIFEQNEDSKVLFFKCFCEYICFEHKLLDFQILCLACLASLYARSSSAKEFALKIWDCCQNINLTNFARFIAFMSLIKSLTYEDTLEISSCFLNSSESATDALINFLQISGAFLRSIDPIGFGNFLDSLLQSKSLFEGSRGGFLHESIIDLRNNEQRLIKKYVNPELETIMKTISFSNDDMKNFEPSKANAIKEFNTKTRSAIFMSISKSGSVSEAIVQITPLLISETFDIDLWIVCRICAAKEPIYNPFYSQLLVKMTQSRYKLRRSGRHLLQHINLDLQNFKYRQVINLGRFYGDIILNSNFIKLSNFKNLLIKCQSIKLDAFMLSLFYAKFWSDVPIEKAFCENNESEVDEDVRSILKPYFNSLAKKIQSGIFQDFPNHLHAIKISEYLNKI